MDLQHTYTWRYPSRVASSHTESSCWGSQPPGTLRWRPAVAMHNNPLEPSPNAYPRGTLEDDSSSANRSRSVKSSRGASSGSRRRPSGAPLRCLVRRHQNRYSSTSSDTGNSARMGWSGLGLRRWATSGHRDRSRPAAFRWLGVVDAPSRPVSSQISVAGEVEKLAFAPCFLRRLPSLPSTSTSIAVASLWLASENHGRRKRYASSHVRLSHTSAYTARSNRNRPIYRWTVKITRKQQRRCFIYWSVEAVQELHGRPGWPRDDDR